MPQLYLGTVLGVVVTLTGIFGYYQESKSADLMGSLHKMKPKDVGEPLEQYDITCH